MCQGIERMGKDTPLTCVMKDTEQHNMTVSNTSQKLLKDTIEVQRNKHGTNTLKRRHQHDRRMTNTIILKESKELRTAFLRAHDVSHR